MVEALSKRIPDAGALDELRRMGFTTIVAHRAPESLLVASIEAAAGPGGSLRRIHSRPEMTAWELSP